jgi:hypothetical protein
MHRLNTLSTATLPHRGCQNQYSQLVTIAYKREYSEQGRKPEECQGRAILIIADSGQPVFFEQAKVFKLLGSAICENISHIALALRRL